MLFSTIVHVVKWSFGQLFFLQSMLFVCSSCMFSLLCFSPEVIVGKLNTTVEAASAFLQLAAVFTLICQIGSTAKSTCTTLVVFFFWLLFLFWLLPFRPVSDSTAQCCPLLDCNCPLCWRLFWSSSPCCWLPSIFSCCWLQRYILHVVDCQQLYSPDCRAIRCGLRTNLILTAIWGWCNWCGRNKCSLIWTIKTHLVMKTLELGTRWGYHHHH